MQTFLPYPDFYKSADCLDWQYSHNRLNNQINEGIIIAKSLLGLYPEGKGWNNHPAVKMWRGYEFHLLEYVQNCMDVWKKKKGVIDIDRSEYIWKLQIMAGKILQTMYYPDWFNDNKFHSAHRSILLAKLPQWYSQFGWSEQPAQRDPVTKRWPYIWPVK